MMILKTSLLNLFISAMVVVFPAAASDFACLKALLPATSHFWVSQQRKGLSEPLVNDSGTAILIAEWKGGPLQRVFIYTALGARKYDQVLVDNKLQPLRSLSLEFIHQHRFSVKIDDLETFLFHIPEARPVKDRLKHFDDGTIETLVETEGDSEKVKRTIADEISTREQWVKNNNLNKARFKAWSTAEQICRAQAAN